MLQIPIPVDKDDHYKSYPLYTAVRLEYCMEFDNEMLIGYSCQLEGSK